jgi:hypothetical protein
MNNEKLQSILSTVSDSLTGKSGQWQLLIDDVQMFCLTDELHNRMRIISPVTDVSEVSQEELMKCLEANFHSALDVRYSISEGVIWVAFIHPLQELTREQVIDAMKQVYSGVLTFGSTYTSSNLCFPTNKENKSKMN